MSSEPIAGVQVQREHVPTAQSSPGQAASLALEFVGVFAGIFAFLLFFRPARFLSAYLPQEGPASVILTFFLSDARWVAACLLAAGLAWLVRRNRDGWSLRDLGFKTHRSWLRDVWFGVLVFSLANVVSLPQTIAVFPGKAALTGAPFLEEWRTVSSSLPVFALACLFWVLSTLLSACWEEIYWRGYVQSLFSRKYSPATGFLVSLLFFSLGHYFTRPEWAWLDVVGAVLGGLAFCVAFYATGSLTVVVVAHALGNLWWDYPFFLYLNGSRQAAYVFIEVLWLLTLILCLVGRKEIAFLWRRSRELFASARIDMTAVGILFASIALLFQWGQAHLIRAGRSMAILTLAVFCVACVALSATSWRTARFRAHGGREGSSPQAPVPNGP